jgi:hypothetical protein
VFEIELRGGGVSPPGRPQAVVARGPQSAEPALHPRCRAGSVLPVVRVFSGRRICVRRVVGVMHTPLVAGVIRLGCL